MKTLEDVRKEIDSTDDEIVSLFVKRLGLCCEVAKEKIKSGKSVYDPERENKVIYRLTGNVSEDFTGYVKELYSAIFSASKSYQANIIGEKSSTSEIIEKIVSGGLKDFPSRAAVACQGVKGANSGTAAYKLFPACDVTFFKNFEGVFSAVDGGLCEYGILPVENSNAGSVLEVYDLMNKYNFHIVRAVKIRIEHCLAGVKGATLKDVKKVISHPQALSQCAEYIKNNKLETESAENTATAAKNLSVCGDKSVAVLCSPDCAELYGLKILARAVQGSADNFTRFICISKEPEIFKGSDKISVMTAIPHRSGSLTGLLAKFSSQGLNLTKIESRPIAGTDFEFMFYFDFEGDVTDAKTLGLIAELENSSDRFVFLGSYKEIS